MIVDELTLYQAVRYFERAVGMSYAPAYALHQASALYQVPAGALAEIILLKLIECARARQDRDMLAAADQEAETGGRSVDRAERDRLIAEARASGESIQAIASRFGLTRQRAHQIVAARKRAGAREGWERRRRAA